MVTTLIDDLNKKIKDSKAKIEFLTPKEREEITQIVNTKTRYFTKYYNENKNNEAKLDLMRISQKPEGEDVKSFINYDEQVTSIKEIFTNIKERVNKEEQEKAELLEEKVLTIMEKLTEGVDY